MRENTFTRNTIIILLLLCAIVTPFSSCQKNEKNPPEGTTPSAESTQPEGNDPPSETLTPPSKEILLQEGKPYTGELNGTHTCQTHNETGLINRTITIYEDTISIESYAVGEEPLGAYTGTLDYDPVTGELIVHLAFEYYEGKGATVHGSSKRVWGKLYEHDETVYFICEKSEWNGISPDDPMAMAFEVQHINPDTLSVAEWAAAGFGEYDQVSRIFYAIRAFLRGDVDDFARRCSVSPKVYDSLCGMKIGEYRVYREEIAAEDDPENTRAYAVLEVDIEESNSDFFTPGIHRLVFDEGLSITFTPREKFKRYTSYEEGLVSPAETYVAQVNSDTDFYRILGENRIQFGLCDFIVRRLNVLADNTDPRTAEEIRAYAEKYLGVDGDTLLIDQTLMKQDDGYILIGRGGGSYISTVLSEEIRESITVVTVQFWADPSKTVSSRKVEFHLEWMDGEYRPIKTVTLEDSGLATAYYST